MHLLDLDDNLDRLGCTRLVLTHASRGDSPAPRAPGVRLADNGTVVEI
jgi:hypothetical protein